MSSSETRALHQCCSFGHDSVCKDLVLFVSFEIASKSSNCRGFQNERATPNEVDHSQHENSLL